MKKFKVEFSWYASMRGYGETEVEAETEEEARELYWGQAKIDYNAHTKIIDCDSDLISITEVPEVCCRCPEGDH